MGFFETQPTITTSTTAFQGSYALSSEIVSQDALSIFIWALVGGLIVGIIFAILKKVTSWVWR